MPTFNLLRHVVINRKQIQGSPELLEVKMNADGYSDGSDENNRDADNDNSIQVSVRLTPIPTVCDQNANLILIAIVAGINGHIRANGQTDNTSADCW